MKLTFEFSDKKQIFTQRYTGDYATRKGLNQSTKDIPQHFIEQIENGSITSLMLEELNDIVPIYVYKTCITIHGNLPKIDIQRIGGYKNVIQNGNGSVEFRYSAIDCKLKKELYDYIQGAYHKQENSTNGIYFERINRFTDKIEAIQYLQAEKNRIDGMNIEGMKANIYVQGYSYFGMYYITTTVLPLLIHGDLLTIATVLTGLSVDTIKENFATIKKEREAIELKWENDRIARENAKAIEDSKRAEMEAILSQKHRQTTINSEGKYITITKTIAGLMYQLIHTYKGSFGRLTYKYQLSNDLNFSGELKDGMKGKQLKANEITTKKVFSYQ